MEIGEIIAVNLRRIRAKRNLSLGQLADMAGVSKVILSQLEKGTANPTINTIWKITGALKLPYTSLLELPDTMALHVKKADIHELDEDGYAIYSYFSQNAECSFELYQIEMTPECVHEAIGHSSNSTEYIMLTEGRMELTVNGESHILDKDDGFCFEAAMPHVYRNLSNTKVKAILMIFYE